MAFALPKHFCTFIVTDSTASQTLHLLHLEYFLAIMKFILTNRCDIETYVWKLQCDKQTLYIYAFMSAEEGCHRLYGILTEFLLQLSDYGSFQQLKEGSSHCYLCSHHLSAMDYVHLFCLSTLSSLK